jgi:serine/threonine protein kinase
MSIVDDPDPFAGKRFGNCLLQRRIGAGTTGSVYLAQHVVLNKPVAVKIVPAELLGSAEDLQGFLREARLAVALDHPYAARLFEVDEANGFCTLAAQYVEGRGLHKRLENGKLEVEEAGAIIKKAALALAAAHKLGLVHRDIKPSNILVSKDGQIKVTDFGTSRSAAAGERILGTPDYMSPERAQGLPLDARSDLYSLGATYYHVVTGHPPFEADTLPALLKKHVHDKPPRPDEIEAAIPSAISALIMKLLSKKPEDRFPTADAFLLALAEAQGAPAPAGDTMADFLSAGDGDAPGPAEAPRAPKPALPRVQPRPAEGKLVLGKYVLRRELGKEDDDLSIWEGENTLTHARVTLRLLTSQDEDRVRAFHGLAARDAELKHPNILHVIESNSDMDRQGGVTHVMAVELPRARTLEEVVSSRQLPPRQLIQLCEQVARALEFAHQKRRTHLKLSPRDVEVELPSRALISFHGFGPAGKEEDLQALPFLAPEQVPNAKATIDARTDVYRLGALLYWISTGKAPYAVSSPAAAHQDILALEPRPPKEIDPKIEPELSRIIGLAMAKTKEMRYAKAGDLADALRKYLKTDLKDAAAAPVTAKIPKARVAGRRRLRVALVALLIALGTAGIIQRQRWSADALAEDIGRERLEALDRYAAGKYDEALFAARRALLLSPNDPAMSRLAKTCARKNIEEDVEREIGRVEEAARRMSQDEFLEGLSALDARVRALREELGTELTADEASSVTAAGIGAFQLGDYEAAVNLLEKAAALGSKDPEGGLALARAYIARMACAHAVGRIVAAGSAPDPRAAGWRMNLTHAMERPTRPAREGADADLADAYAAIGRGEMSRVKSLTGALLDRKPGAGAAAEALALRAWAAAGSDLADLDASIKARPLQTLAYVLRAVRHAERGRLADAAADLSAPAKLFPNLPVFSLLRAKVRHSMGDLEGAREDLARVKAQAGPAWEFQAPLDRLRSALPELDSPPK